MVSESLRLSFLWPGGNTKPLDWKERLRRNLQAPPSVHMPRCARAPALAALMAGIAMGSFPDQAAFTMIGGAAQRLPDELLEQPRRSGG